MMRKNVIMIPSEASTPVVSSSPSSSFSASSCCSIHCATQSSQSVRLIRLRKAGSEPFGFSIRGGREHGTGVFVSEVHPGSEADVQGLVAGDEIIKVNGFTSDQASHEEVSRIIKSSHKISLKVKTTVSGTGPGNGSLDTLPITGSNNNSSIMRDPRWTVVPMIVTSGTTSATHAKHHLNHHQHHHQPQQTFNPVPASTAQPRRKCPIHHTAVTHHRHHQLPSHHHHPSQGMGGSGSKFHSTSSRGSSSSPSDSDQDQDMMLPPNPNPPFPDPESEIVEEKVYITLKTGQSMGCSVVRGPAAYPGIFVQDVKPGSPSGNAGLEIGDQILAMNGFSFYPGHYNFDDAINKIKACTQMTLTVRKRVGLHLFHDIKRKNNVHKIRAVVHSPQENDSDYDPEKDFDLTGICGVHSGHHQQQHQTEVKMLSGMTLVNGSYAEEILEKVRLEEERLAEDRRILAAEQHKLQQEIKRLALERKELEAMRLQGKSEDGGSSISSGDVSMLSSSSPDPLASCSVSSTSCNSSTSSSCETTTGNNTITSAGSPALGFLDELKQLAEKRSSSDSSLLLDTLKKTATSDASHHPGNTTSGLLGPAGAGAAGRIRVVKQLHPDDEKRKRHELLMEEFKSAHLRMFGKASNLVTGGDPASSSSSACNAGKVSQVGEIKRNEERGTTASLTNQLVTPASSSPAVDDESAAAGVIRNGGNVGNNKHVNGVTSSAAAVCNSTIAAGRALFSKRNVTSNGTSAAPPPTPAAVKASSSPSSPPLSDKTITTSVTRSPGNSSSVTSSSSTQQENRGMMQQQGAPGMHGEKVMILKTSSALNCGNSSRKHHPPPPPPPLPGTTTVTSSTTTMIATATGGSINSPAASHHPRPQQTAPAPLVTITSYQTKSRGSSSNNNRFLTGLESKSSPHQHAPPVKINLIKSTRDDK